MTDPKHTNTDPLDSIILRLSDDIELVRYRVELKALKPADAHAQKKILRSRARQAIQNYINSRVITAKHQMKANVFVQFKVAMTAQDLSARPPEGARFRTPLEELSLILENEAPLDELNQLKEKGALFNPKKGKACYE